MDIENGSTLNKELSDIVLELDNIFLDPNNPRFVTVKWEDVPDSKIDDLAIQDKTMQRMEADFSISKLVDNMEANGFLTIDRVIVKEFKPNKYVVLEGNRRICAAKAIKNKSLKNPESIKQDVLESIERINCLVYTGSEQQASWIFQGLRHIIGIQEWSSFNKAKLLVRLIEEENLGLAEVGKKFGLSSYGAAQWIRGYYAFMQAVEESDYTKEINEYAYPYFQELFSRSNPILRDWLKWNDTDYKFEDSIRFNEFLSWLYPKNEEESRDGIEKQGDWENRRIKRSNDIRIISFLIKESITDFDAFRIDGDLEKAQNSANMKKYLANQDPSIETIEKIKACTKALEDIPYKLILGKKDELMELLTSLDKTMKVIIEACQ